MFNKLRRAWLSAALFCLLSSVCSGQSPRLNDFNSIGWFVYVGDHKFTTNWAIHTEYQWRRTGGLTHPQQNLARIGVVRTLTDRIKLSAGYTNFQSFQYGTHPDVEGKAEPENRFYEDITLKDKLGRLGLEQRVRLEQRWLGSRDETGQGPVEDWNYQHRIRYQLSVEFPLKGPGIDKGEFYLDAFDELFIGFGRNVADNVFNQNRLSAGLGYQFSADMKAELNYLYQIRQHAEPDPVLKRSVVELNQGFRLNLIYNIDFTRNP